jgi:hypothetical protein
VTDSIEVVQSEQSLASANDQYITSLYSHNLAKLALARSVLHEPILANTSEGARCLDKIRSWTKRPPRLQQ